MSVKSAREFIERVKNDPAFAERVVACPDAGARRELVLGEGFDFTKKDIEAVMSELSEEDLAMVTGGRGQGFCFNLYVFFDLIFAMVWGDFCSADLNLPCGQAYSEYPRCSQ